MNNGTTSFCGACGASLIQGANFCSSCGARLHTTSLLKQLLGLSVQKKGILLSTVVVLFSGAFGLQSYLEHKTGRAKPTEIYLPPANPAALPPGHPGGGSEAAAGFSPEGEAIKTLRTALESDQENIEKMRMFVGAVADQLREAPQASPQLALEAIDVLSRLLQKVPNDPEALVTMADISFDQKAFSKALDFYKRYLSVKPTDAGARARYASTLTFLGKFDESISELDSIIQSDPKNFPAQAYLSITYAQKGDIARAKEVAASALAVAPSDEARARFSSFVASLDVEQQNPRGGAGSSQSPTQQGSSATIAPEGEIVTAVRMNPIAGQKFVRAEVKDGINLLLVFDNFPMQAMPPFAKEKFFAGLKQKASSARAAGIKRILFIDDSSGTQMDELSLEKE